MRISALTNSAVERAQCFAAAQTLLNLFSDPFTYFVVVVAHKMQPDTHIYKGVNGKYACSRVQRIYGEYGDDAERNDDDDVPRSNRATKTIYYIHITRRMGSECRHGHVER